MSESDFRNDFKDRIAALQQERPAPLAAPVRDGFSAPSDPNLQRTTIIKMDKYGRYKSKGGEDFTGRKVVVKDVVEYWAALKKGEPPRKIPLTYSPTGEPLPARKTLGDTDHREWPLGLDGKTRVDPWTPVAELSMVLLETGAAVIFSTTSKTGRGAVAELKGHVSYHRRMFNNDAALPIIELAVRIWSSDRWGDTFIPSLTAVGWVDAAPADVIEASATVVEQPAIAPPALKRHGAAKHRGRIQLEGDDLDDEIPSFDRTK